ncbi:uncharacterized protein [Pithys albifrons albifrons]|uniref:uncharacterized protein isoform X1 n=1 Tax=Pithys albifrons albifrons TaxID=3385563 RepID=UPI003A5D06D8
MGKLDAHAKRRIVELRKAGLSFRKIKDVLELDNIRVTPQAVYLFLKRRTVEPGAVAAGWDGDQPWPPLQAQEAEPPRLLDPEPPAVPPGDATGSRAPSPAGTQDTKEGIQILSVVSLCKDEEQPGDTQPMGMTPGNGDDSSTGNPVAPGGLATLPQPLSGQGQQVTAPAVPLGDATGSHSPCSAGTPDTKEGIQILSVVSLCKDEEQLGDTQAVGMAPGNGDDSSTGTPVAPGGLATLPQPVPGQGQQVTPQPRSPALTVQAVTVDKAALLQDKVKDASTQTALLNPVGPENPSLAWDVPVPPCAASSQALADKLDAVQTEVRRLSQALHVVLERQCRLERQQEQQQRLQHEVLVTLQQLSSTVSHGAVPANQPCGPFGSVAEPSPTMPDFSQFKIELI